jgi:ABC-type glycerol-3-phosphate transport system permease component
MANRVLTAPQGRRRTASLGAIVLKVATYVILTAGAATMVLPFLWMLSTSVMTLGEANTGRLLPRAARLTCPHVNLTKTIEGGVVEFAVSPTVRAGAQELHTGSYYVEVQQSPEDQAWQFRLVDNGADPISIAVNGQPGSPFSEEWQPVPVEGGVIDTERGMAFAFASPPVLEEGGRRSGAARTDYVNCCEYPSWMLEKRQAERAGRTYTGPRIETDLSNCRTAGRLLSYLFVDLISGNYRQAWVTARFSEYIRNSIFLTAVTISGLLVVSTLAAYAFARMEFPGREMVFGLLLSTMMIPATVTMIPNFLTITGNNPFLPFIKWYDSWPALTIPFMASFFNIFMLRQFFAQVPNELWDAAQIDGAGHLRFLARIVLPLSTAPLMTVIIFSFISSWNSLLWPLIATKAGSNWWPVSVGLQNFVTEAGPETHLWMAGASISMMPVLILYFVAQKQFIEGIATTGLKG